MFQVFAPIQCLTLIRNQIYSGWWEKTPGLVDQPIVFVFCWSSIKAAPEHIVKTSLHRRCPLLLCRVWMKCSYNKESFFRPISFSTQTTENTKLESDGCEKGGGEGLGLEFSKTKKNKPKHNIYICQVLRLRSAGGQMPGLLGLFSLHIFKNIFGFKKNDFPEFFRSSGHIWIFVKSLAFLESFWFEDFFGFSRNFGIFNFF